MASIAHHTVTYNATPSAASEGSQSGGGSGIDHPNEPAGYTLITERSFAALDEDTWADADGAVGTLTIETDATAPKSPSSIGRSLFPVGLGSGSSGDVAKAIYSGFSATELYIEFWLRVSDNWDGNDSGINKIFYLTGEGSGGGGDPLFFLLTGAGAGTLHFAIRGQNSELTPTQREFYYNSNASGGEDIYTNEISPASADAEIVRGQWHHVEVVIVCNTPGESDGEVHAWLDETKILQFTAAEFMSADDVDGALDNFRWEPIYGGAGDDVQVEQYIDCDHIYMSGVTA